ncbi:MFS transporter [Streptomonospora nanhaiensis]|uniref:NNP family nitrate/nitrite transporter-like MFS transporter n=1 Tax=Streptomonospora nanhaiensis TaxID=1323731 RepID=A0A853BGF1_9ACTN|nr:nitrate/nitrite transporter [Streptomonospora nanhaiensis]MBV2366777.1 NarK/NasA family nitrate transporter [Streptomonospora nanhaiensis]MBX9391059.1 NarK/NasA family nitrate transporter [Streptomonospora nanhaiensis]NYI94393.1 NNP family nitrate/nitrite transporter-like MFS transporter [Streptomonospora nanhaiensis]
MTSPHTPTPHRARGRWIADWDPEDTGFWAASGRRIANRNLWASILAEHLGFSIWSIWSVLTLFMTPETGFDYTPEQKFLLVSVVTLVGAVLRVPYTLAVPKFGGRNWTLVSASALLVPTVIAVVLIQRPDTPYWLFLVLAATAGLGGGNFSSSMSNINAFFPERHKGWALGLNAGGGNIGVAVVQLAGLGVIAAFGVGQGYLLAALYVPLLLLASVIAWTRMDNLVGARADVGAQVAAARDRHFWIMSFLYIGTFGSFIGFSFAYGLLLQNQFGRTPLEAAALTFLGPLLGSLIRPVGGRLADRFGGARVTLWNFAAMAGGIAVIVLASFQQSLWLFTVAFAVLFVLAGIGNGSTYKMIPAIYAAEAQNRIAAGAPREEVLAHTKRVAGAVLGLVGAVGALGGVAINLVFRQSFLSFGGATPAYIAFGVFYLVCMAVTYRVYLRAPAAPARRPAAASAGADEPVAP